MLANAFLWSGSLFYNSYDRLSDQSAAGAVMMVEESLTTIALFGWLFFKWMREGNERQAIEELAAARESRSTPAASRGRWPRAAVTTCDAGSRATTACRLAESPRGGQALVTECLADDARR
jgi:hypothetical protein